MIDPPREGVKEAVAACYEAKIRIMMITGDNRVTAKAIAESIGMKGEGKKEMASYTGDEIKGLNDFELRKILKARSVIFSRVSPDDKFRLVSILRDMGDIVAVTGDGVNDTLSLKKAHIGVAMGKAGSEVAKEASEIVLLDDNFSTLTHAIREGRTIYQNLKKTVLANIMANLGELTTVLIGFVGLAFQLPYPITAVQILAVDLIGELLPLTAITFDTGEKRIMQARPRKTEEHIINKHSLISAIVYGMAIGAFAYLAFYAVHILGGGTHAQGQTAAYLTIVLAQLANIVGARSEESFFSAYTFTNPYLWGAIGLSLIFISVLTYVPLLAFWFKFEGLNLVQWMWPVLGAVGMLLLHEIRKRGFKWTMG
jgi:Ca2+-transporting ATPase